MIQLTLAALRGKDPKIYDEKCAFFTKNEGKSGEKSTKAENRCGDAKMFLKDYERKIILEKGG